MLKEQKIYHLSFHIFHLSLTSKGAALLHSNEGRRARQLSNRGKARSITYTTKPMTNGKCEMTNGKWIGSSCRKKPIMPIDYSHSIVLGGFELMS